MHRFKNILLHPSGTDADDDAARRVGDLVRHNGAALTVLGVVADPPSGVHGRHEHATAVLEAERVALTASLTRCAAATGHAPTEVQIRQGDPSPTIIDRVREAGHDLVVVVHDEPHDPTVRRLLRLCPCPVWVMRPGTDDPPRVLAAVNPDPDEAALNTTILELASSLAGTEGAELHLVHAWELYGESTMRFSPYLRSRPEDVDALVEQERASHLQAVDAMLRTAGVADRPWQVHLVKGRPEDVVPQMVTDQGVTVLVMGTVARAGMRGAVIGNTAERVLEDVACSVVAVKPPGFESPVAGGGR